MPRRIHLDSKHGNNPVWQDPRPAVRYFLLFTLLLVLLCTDSIPSCTPDAFFMSPSSPPRDGHIFKEAYVTTRREAIVDYVIALQDSDGYFYGYLQCPPPFEPDGTSATFASVLDAYEALDHIDCLNKLNWSSTIEFLASLIDHGMLNLSKDSGPSVFTCRTALTLYSSLGLQEQIDVDSNAEYVAALQQSNGGFVSRPGRDSVSLVHSFFALDTLRIADRLAWVNLASARDFVRACHNEDGGFSNILGAESDFNYAPAGIMLMDILGIRGEMNVSLTSEYLLQYWDNESGCDVNGDLLFTQRIAWSLWLLDRTELIDSEKMFQWILSLQKHAHGEFVGYPECGLDGERLVMVNYATHLLDMYDGLHHLDSNFSVDEKPVWSIPQWWIDYIEEEWGTVTEQDGFPPFWFRLPDMSFIFQLAPYALVASLVMIPALWIVQRNRARRIERRELKKSRRKRRNGE